MKYIDVTKNKVYLMGIAMLLIMFFHAQVRVDNTFLYYIHYYGYIGVDLFLFLSGIGCLYSYRKNKNKKNFFKKRFFRLLPTYLPIAIILNFLREKLKVLKFSFLKFVGNLTLEIYSMHERLIILGFFIFKEFGIVVSIYGIKYNLFIGVVTIVLAYFWNKIVKYMLDYSK